MLVKFDQSLVNSYIDIAISEFKTNPLSTRLIRRISNEFPDLFVASALRYLDSPDQSSAHRFLSSLMLRQERVFDEVADPARGPLARSVNLFKRLWRIDGSFDVKLARRFPDRTGRNHDRAFDRPRSLRAFDILNEISVGRRLIPIVGHLTESRDTAIAAKATLFIGRRIQNPQWAARQITRDNPEEVRANAVESLWGIQSPTAENLLETCACDESVSVAGNALVGLHKLGKPGIIQQINEMVTAATPEFRTTAAWTMGRIGDSAFADPLTELLKDDSPQVRSVALQSLLHLRRAEATAREEAAKQGPPPSKPEPVPSHVVKPPSIDMDVRLDGSVHSTRSDRYQGSD